MTDLAFDLYLLAAALGLVPAVAYAGMPVLAQSAFLAVGAVGAMQLERVGLPIGSAVVLAVSAGGVRGCADRLARRRGAAAAGRARDVGARVARDRRRCSPSPASPAARRGSRGRRSTASRRRCSRSR